MMRSNVTDLVPRLRSKTPAVSTSTRKIQGVLNAAMYHGIVGKNPGMRNALLNLVHRAPPDAVNIQVPYPFLAAVDLTPKQLETLFVRLLEEEGETDL